MIDILKKSALYSGDCEDPWTSCYYVAISCGLGCILTMSIFFFLFQQGFAISDLLMSRGSDNFL